MTAWLRGVVLTYPPNRLRRLVLTYPPNRLRRLVLTYPPNRLRRLVIALALGFGVALAGAASAARADEGPGDRAQTFEAVTGAVKEDVPGGPLLVAAYALIWIAVFAYVFRLVRLQRGADENLARLQQDLSKAVARSQTPK